jgi:hypothetical protein
MRARQLPVAGNAAAARSSDDSSRLVSVEKLPSFTPRRPPWWGFWILARALYRGVQVAEGVKMPPDKNKPW